MRYRTEQFERIFNLTLDYHGDNWSWIQQVYKATIFLTITTPETTFNYLCKLFVAPSTESHLHSVLLKWFDCVSFTF